VGDLAKLSDSQLYDHHTQQTSLGTLFSHLHNGIDGALNKYVLSAYCVLKIPLKIRKASPLFYERHICARGKVSYDLTEWREAPSDGRQDTYGRGKHTWGQQKVKPVSGALEAMGHFTEAARADPGGPHSSN
jgi:hypothetical protein